MDTAYLSVLAIVIVAVIAFALGRLYESFRQMKVEIAKLKEAQAKHLPYKTLEYMEDGMAALNYFKFELDLWEEFLDNARAHFSKARNGVEKPDAG